MGANEVRIYSKHIQFDVVLQRENVWAFMLAFGEEFTTHLHGVGTVPSPVDGYYHHQTGYHVQVSVHTEEVQKFNNFLRGFCQTHNLFLRESDLVPLIP